MSQRRNLPAWAINDETGTAPKSLAELVLAEDAARLFMVDFDHTLLLSNSTEEFLNCSRPASICGLALKALAVFRPWALAGSNGYRIWRDVIRVSLILLIAPWTYLLFRRQARSIFNDFGNRELIELLEGVRAEQIVIVSFGFSFVVRAMLKGSRFENCQVVAPSLFNMARYRKLGKMALLRDQGVKTRDTHDVVITDNAEDDADLIKSVNNSFHIEWPQRLNREALYGLYIPFFYTAKIKRDTSFLFKQVFLEEFAIVMIAFGLLNPFVSIPTLGALGLLFAAYLLVYEIGYAENDRLGYAYEKEPKLTEGFFTYRDYQLEPQAWYWAAGLTVLGALMLPADATAAALERLSLSVQPGVLSAMTVAAIWMLAIVIGRVLYALYNRLPVQPRVYAYLGLHASKYCSPALLFLCHHLGFLLLAAHIVRTWSLYAVRRAGGNIEFISSQLVRVIFLVLFLFFYQISADAQLWTRWEAWVIVGWCVLRSIPEVRRKLFV